MEYLLKITFTWGLFLLLYQLLYQNSGKYTTNRIYLLLSMAAGLLLPLIRLPHKAPAVVTATQSIYPVATAPIQNAALTISAATQPLVATQGIDLWWMIGVVYIIGLVALVVKSLLELFKMFRLMRRGERQVMQGQQVITTRGNHAPYSFMGRIFMGNPAAYTQEELDCIIRHESAHNQYWHWLDLLLVQMVCIALWFHPLVWRFRYLLQLQHEYEADDRAANNDAYSYGHFLLQQTLLGGVPALAHSLHFSPIKNRIKMLTKRQNQKSDGWKYLLLIPAVLGCTFLMARAASGERVQQGNVTYYKDNTFVWRHSDTLSYDRSTKRAEREAVDAKVKNQIISSMNNEPVYRNEYLAAPASYGLTELAYVENLQKKFSAACKNTRDSATRISISNLVIDKAGRVVYYDARYNKPYVQGIKTWKPFPDQEPVLNTILDKIITESPNWKPAKLNGLPVTSVVNIRMAGC